MPYDINEHFQVECSVEIISDDECDEVRQPPAQQTLPDEPGQDQGEQSLVEVAERAPQESSEIWRPTTLPETGPEEAPATDAAAEPSSEQALQPSSLEAGDEPADRSVATNVEEAQHVPSTSKASPVKECSDEKDFDVLNFKDS